MEYSSYDQVPWYRKQGFCIFGIIIAPILLPILLTGHVYYDGNGQVLTYNKTKRWLLAALGSIVFSVLVVMLVPNRPGGWEKIGEGPNLTYYADSSSVHKLDNNATIWLLANNKEIQEDNGKSYLSSKQQYEIDCKGARKRLVRYALYTESMGKGREVAMYNLPDHEWSPATPGTVAGSMRELSCKRPWWKFWH